MRAGCFRRSPLDAAGLGSALQIYEDQLVSPAALLQAWLDPCRALPLNQAYGADLTIPCVVQNTKARSPRVAVDSLPILAPRSTSTHYSTSYPAHPLTMSTRHSYPSGPSRDRDRDRERPRDDRYPAPSRPPLPPQAARFSPPAAPAPARYERAEYPPSGPRDYARAEPPRERERYRDVDPARAGLVKGSYTRAPPREQRRESYERRDSTGHGATSQVAGPLQHCTLHYCTQLTPHVQITPRLAPRLPTAPPPPPPLALTLAPQAPPLPFALPAPQTPALSQPQSTE